MLKAREHPQNMQLLTSSNKTDASNLICDLRCDAIPAANNIRVKRSRDRRLKGEMTSSQRPWCSSHLLGIRPGDCGLRDVAVLAHDGLPYRVPPTRLSTSAANSQHGQRDATEDPAFSWAASPLTANSFIPGEALCMKALKHTQRPWVFSQE